MREIQIGSREEGQKLIRLLGRYFPNASAGFLYKMLRKKNIKLNDGKANGSETLHSGDCIRIYFSEETMRHFTGEEEIQNPKEKKGDHNVDEPGRKGLRKKSSMKESLHRRRGVENLRDQVRILKETEDILILHKPAGLLSQKSKKKDDSLNDWLLDYCLDKGYVTEASLAWFRPSIVNRLDRNTSGIVLAGLTAAGLKTVSGLLRNRSIEKYYLAVVKGLPAFSGRISAYLRKDPGTNRVRLYPEPVEGASLIQTECQILDFQKESASSISCPFPVSLLRVRLITGKSHQIRAHLAWEGYPLLGDSKYGNRSANQWMKEHFGTGSQLLHSYELTIPENLQSPAGDPEDRSVRLQTRLAGLHIKDPVPFEMNRVLKELGLSC